MEHYTSKIRPNGQMTIPKKVRELMGLSENDEVIFYVGAGGSIIIERQQKIDPEQAWFWAERWQKLERETQADTDAGRILEFDNVEDALDALDSEAE